MDMSSSTSSASPQSEPSDAALPPPEGRIAPSKTPDTPINENEDAQASPPRADADGDSPKQISRRPTTQTDTDPRHCWICLQDEGIDSPFGLEWRTPCPCRNMQAHEDCLLEWLSDVQNSGSGGGVAKNRIYCPQCKTEIKVKKPIELVVAVTDLFRAIGRQLVLPAGAAMIIGCLYSGSMAYGFNTIQLIFGIEETQAMLFREQRGRSMLSELIPEIWINRIIDKVIYFNPFIPNARGSLVFAISPLIAPALLLSKSRLADRVFQFVPVAYLLFPTNHPQLFSWPPTPGLAFAMLPYIRLSYLSLYDKYVYPQEKKWELAVQRKPREGETTDDVARALQREDDEDNLLGIAVEIDYVEEADVADAPEGAEPVAQPAPNEPEAQAQPAVADQPQPPVAAAQNDANAPRPPPPQIPAEANAAPDPPRNAEQQQWEFRQTLSTAALARAMISALFLPAVSSVMGDLLRSTLPASWVLRPKGHLTATGLLQDKWGRTLVGGMLWIVARDSLGLYVKWRKAQNQEKRKVLDYKGPRSGSSSRERQRGSTSTEGRN